MHRRRPLDWGWVLGAPMAVGGIWAAAAAARWWLADRSWPEVGGIALLAVLGIGIGGAWGVVSIRATRDTLRRNRLAARFPDEPWRWRADWDARRIRHAGRTWGATWLELETLPGTIGGSLTATIIPSHRELRAEGLHVALSANRVVVTRAPPRQRTEHTVLWAGRAFAPIEVHASGPRARFTIAIPADLPESNDDHPNSEVFWRVDATGDVHGRRFEAVFLVPVFR